MAPRNRSKLVVGTLSVTRGGTAFLVPERSGEDLFVAADHRGNAYHGDKVVARLDAHKRGRPAGRIVQVLERASVRFVGSVRRSPRSVRVSSDDPRSPRDIVIPLGEAGAARDGEKVVVEIVDWGGAHARPVGRISERLGMSGEPGLDVLVIIKKHGLRTGFPPEVEAAAEALPADLPQDELGRRHDLRGIPTFTIDPATARDHDDALSLVELEDGNLELGVHIADVSHYVRFEDPLDREARERGTSVYLVDRVLPMLPEKISNDLCSLKPGVDRLAFSVRIVLTPRGRVLETRIEDTIIRSRAKLSYEEVQAFFDGRADALDGLEALSGPLEGLRRLAAVLHLKRTRRGSLDLDLPESRVELDDEGVPVEIQKVARLESHRLVEEFMLLANELVAVNLLETKTPGVHRVHEEPPEERIGWLHDALAPFGYVIRPDSRGRVPPRELQRILRGSEGKPEEPIVHALVLRSLARARYDVEPRGHYGLALRHYAHFTSPIRRYPDLLVHRALRILAGRQPTLFPERERTVEWLTDAAARSSDRERAAESAERDSVELKKVQYMERHVGDVFPGTVTGIEAYGFFVELDELHVSGLVHVHNLIDDFYEYRAEDRILVGRRTGHRLSLGDRVAVQVVAVRRELRQIDFLLLEGGRRGTVGGSGRGTRGRGARRTRAGRRGIPARRGRR